MRRNCGVELAETKRKEVVVAVDGRKRESKREKKRIGILCFGRWGFADLVFW